MPEYDPSNPTPSSAPPPAAPPPAAPPPAAPAPAAPAAPMAPAAPSPLSTLMASMSRAELFIAGGALLIIVVDLVLGILARQYSAGSIVWASAAVALIAILGRKRLPAAVSANYEWLLIGLVALAVLVGARELLSELVSIVRSPSFFDAADLIGMVGYYGGIAAMGFGGWQLWKRNAA